MSGTSPIAYKCNAPMQARRSLSLSLSLFPLPPSSFLSLVRDRKQQIRRCLMERIPIYCTPPSHRLSEGRQFIGNWTVPASTKSGDSFGPHAERGVNGVFMFVYYDDGSSRKLESLESRCSSLCDRDIRDNDDDTIKDEYLRISRGIKTQTQ